MNLADLSDKFPRELKVSYMRLLSFGNKNSIAIPSTAFQSHGFLLHTDSATNTQTEAFPTNNTTFQFEYYQ